MGNVGTLNVTSGQDMGAWIPTVTSKKVYKQPKAKLYFGPKRKKKRTSKLTRSEKSAMKHANTLGAGAKKRRKLVAKSKRKVVMAEFERGTLHSGSGDIVTNPKQAVAIAYSEARRQRAGKIRRRRARKAAATARKRRA